MPRYWLIHKYELKGPFDPEDLRGVPGFDAEALVCPDTPEDVQAGSWRRAGELDELAAVVLARTAIDARPLPHEPTLEDLAGLRELDGKVTRLAGALGRAKAELRDRDQEVLYLRHQIKEKEAAAEALREKVGELKDSVDESNALQDELSRVRDEHSRQAETLGGLRERLENLQIEAEEKARREVEERLAGEAEERAAREAEERAAREAEERARRDAEAAAAPPMPKIEEKAPRPSKPRGFLGTSLSAAEASFILVPLLLVGAYLGYQRYVKAPEPKEESKVARREEPPAERPPAPAVKRGKRRKPRPRGSKTARRAGRRSPPASRAEARAKTARKKPAKRKPPKVTRRAVSEPERPKITRRVVSGKPPGKKPSVPGSKPPVGKARDAIALVKGFPFASGAPGTCPKDLSTIADETKKSWGPVRTVGERVACGPYIAARGAINLWGGRGGKGWKALPRVKKTIDRKGGIGKLYRITWTGKRIEGGRYRVKVTATDKLTPLVAAALAPSPEKAKKRLSLAGRPPVSLVFEADIGARTVKPLDDGTWVLLDGMTYLKWTSGAGRKGRAREIAPRYKALSGGRSAPVRGEEVPPWERGCAEPRAMDAGERRAVEFLQFFPVARDEQAQCPVDLDSIERDGKSASKKPRQVLGRVLCDPARIARSWVRSEAKKGVANETELADDIRKSITAWGGLDTVHPFRWSAKRIAGERYAVSVCHHDTMTPLLVEKFSPPAQRDKRRRSAKLAHPPKTREYEADLEAGTVRPKDSESWKLIDRKAHMDWIISGKQGEGGPPRYRAGKKGFAVPVKDPSPGSS